MMQCPECHGDNTISAGAGAYWCNACSTIFDKVGVFESLTKKEDPYKQKKGETPDDALRRLGMVDSNGRPVPVVVRPGRMVLEGGQKRYGR